MKNLGTKNTDKKNKDAKNKDAKNKDTKNKDTKNKDTKNKDTKNKDTKNKDAKNKDTKNKDIKNKDAKSIAIKNKDTMNKIEKNKNKDTKNVNSKTKETTNSSKRDLEKRKKLVLEVVERLKKAYPDAGCTLEYEKEQAWKLLVSVRLAAQCTDARVNVVVEDLYKKYPTVQALAEASPADIEKIVHPCGLGNSKARDIHDCMKILHEKYQDRVPDTMDELLALPGVGRKSANLILGDVYGKPAIVTDTHCIRLSNRIGLVDHVIEPAKVERELRKIVPPEEGNDLCHRFVEHGRAVCSARKKPDCEVCCLREVCAKNV